MAWLDLRRLTYFNAICEAGSISEAARQISVPQPVLSYHLRELELDFGGPLLTRSPKGIVPTEGGRLLQDHATIILAQVKRAESELRALQTRGHADPRILRVSAIPSVATELTPLLLQQAGEIAPLTGLYVLEANTREGREMLAEGEADFAIIIADDATPETQWLSAESMLFCMAASHTDKETGPITLAEALSEPLMIPSQGSPMRHLVDRLARSIGAEVKVSHQIDGPNPRKQAVIAGLGRTFLPWIAVHEEVEKGLIRYREVVDPPLARHVGLEWRDGLEPQVTTSMQSVLTVLLKAMLK